MASVQSLAYVLFVALPLGVIGRLCSVVVAFPAYLIYYFPRAAEVIYLGGRGT